MTTRNRPLTGSQALALMAIFEDGQPYTRYPKVRSDTLAALRNRGLIEVNPRYTAPGVEIYRATAAGIDWLKSQRKEPEP